MAGRFLVKGLASDRAALLQLQKFHLSLFHPTARVGGAPALLLDMTIRNIYVPIEVANVARHA
jgi:hypothetical protein